MKKLESSILNMVLSLVCVAVVMGIILAYVHKVTEGPVAEQDAKVLADGIKAVMGADELEVKNECTIEKEIKGKTATFTAYETVDNDGEALGVAVRSTTGGFGGDLNVLVGFDTEGNILGYTLLSHSETPGLGAKADKWFQADGKGSIIGKHPERDNLTVSKDGGDIDAITASTITSRAFLLAISQAYDAYHGVQTDGSTSATCRENVE